MIPPREILESWRDEIALEIDPLDAELRQARADLARAQQAYDVALSAYNTLATLLHRGEGMDGTPGLLLGRLAELRDSTLRPLADARSAATGRISSLSDATDSRRAALAHIARALAPDTPRARIEPAPRRDPAPIEYDLIVMS